MFNYNENTLFVTKTEVPLSFNFRIILLTHILFEFENLS